MSKVIKGRNQLLSWLVDLMAFFQTETIKIPDKYRDKVIAVKEVLEDDTSGLVNTVLDFGITCALVDYRIETDNENLTEILNDWLGKVNLNINADSDVKSIPTGLEALAKEYFRERWKGSSHLLLRTFWEEEKGLNLPTTLFFVDGEDIKCSPTDKEGAVVLGAEKYKLRIGTDTAKDLPLPNDENEKIFVQKPFESWGVREPIPWLIRKGLYRNLKFFTLMSSKGEYIVGKALEYLFAIYKGSERLFLDGQVTYGPEDLKTVSDDLAKLVQDKKNSAGLPSYATQWDTKFEHIIPDYSKAVNDAIYSPIEKRLLSGLGLVDIVEGTSSSRRESILNPKPFIAEVNQGVKDFKALLRDIIQYIIVTNSSKHPKWMSAKIEVHSSPTKEFMNKDIKQLLRSIYDRGSLSKRTLVEVVGELNYDLEKEYRKKEKADGDEKLMFAPVIQNNPKGATTNNVPAAKLGPEAKNFTQATCKKCQEEFLIEEANEVDDGVLECPNCGEELKEDDIIEGAKVFEQAPYNTIQDLPKQLQHLPAGAKTLWMKVFNESYPKGEDYARKVAWSVVKKTYKKVGDKWTKKSKGNLTLKDIGQLIEEIEAELVVKK